MILSPEPVRGSRISTRMQRDAAVISTVGGGCRVDSFAECQQPAEGAPLMRTPIMRLDAAFE